MKWDITHRTQYTYAAPVRDSVNEVRLQPISNEEQLLESFDLKIFPATTPRSFHDFYSNDVHRFEIFEPHTTLSIESRCLVAIYSPPELGIEARPAPLAQLKDVVKIGRCYDFLQASRFVEIEPETWRLALDSAAGIDDAWQAALAIMRFVNTHLTYAPNSTHVHTHMREALKQKRGVCQDFAHVMIGLCRALKIPALYASGYLATENASATHAWMEVFIPGIGWRGLDPTHDRQVNENYIKLAVGRDYADVPPVAGHYKGTPQRKMQVDVKIIPAAPSPDAAPPADPK